MEIRVEGKKDGGEGDEEDGMEQRGGGKKD